MPRSKKTTKTFTVYINGAKKNLNLDNSILSAIDKNLTENEYRKMLHDPKIAQLLQNFTTDGTKLFIDLLREEQAVLDADVKIMADLKFPYTQTRKLKLLIAKKLAEKMAKDPKVAEALNPVKPEDVGANAHAAIKKLLALETNNINRHLKNQAKQFGIAYVPFKFIVQEEKLRMAAPKGKPAKYKREYVVYLVVDDVYFNFVFNRQVNFINYLYEQKEYDLAMLIGRDIYLPKVTHVRQINFSSLSKASKSTAFVFTPPEQARFKNHYREFTKKVKTEPSKYQPIQFLNFNNEPIVHTHLKIPKFNKLFGLRIASVTAQLKTEQESFTPEQILGLPRFFNLHINQEAQNLVNESRRLSQLSDDGSEANLNFILNFPSFYARVAKTSAPELLLRNSNENLKKLMAEVIDKIVTDVLDFQGKELKNNLGLEKLLKESSLAEYVFQQNMPLAPKWIEGLKGYQLGTKILQSRKNTRYRQRPADVKFPNIMSILFWWITSGQYKQQAFDPSKALRANWEKVKYYHPENKATFLNKLIFLIANSIYEKKTEALGQKLSKKVPITHARKYRHGQISRRDKKQQERIAKYATWITDLRRVNPNPYRFSRKFRMSSEFTPKNIEEKITTNYNLHGRVFKSRKEKIRVRDIFNKKPPKGRKTYGSHWNKRKRRRKT